MLYLLKHIFKKPFTPPPPTLATLKKYSSFQPFIHFDTEKDISYLKQWKWILIKDFKLGTYNKKSNEVTLINPFAKSVFYRISTGFCPPVIQFF